LIFEIFFLVAKSAADLESRKKQLEAQINAMSTGPTGRAAGNLLLCHTLSIILGSILYPKIVFMSILSTKIDFLPIFELKNRFSSYILVLIGTEKNSEIDLFLSSKIN
jgi:hypothetical protein